MGHLVEGGGPEPGSVHDEVHGPLELAGLGVHAPRLENVQGLGHGGGDGALTKNRAPVKPIHFRASDFSLLLAIVASFWT